MLKTAFNLWSSVWEEEVMKGEVYPTVKKILDVENINCIISLQVHSYRDAAWL